ncbi:hypothetical protein BJX99DRAFT_82665 [Aspergillus californicus]
MTVQENTPLLGLSPDKPSLLHRFKTHLTTEINPHKADLILLFCYTITGILDSSAVFIWGCFVSMQTGNTVYLGLGLSGLDDSGSQRWLKSLISISSFCLGSFFFSLLHHRLPFFQSPRDRGALALSFLLQMVCVAIATGIVTATEQTKNDNLSWKIGVPLALVAFQSSGQAVTSRVVGFSSLTSVVLTSVYCDLFSFPGNGAGFLEAFKNRDEWRRVGAVLGLFLGILLGGLWATSEVGSVVALWMAVLCKGGIVLAWLCWEGDERVE